MAFGESAGILFRIKGDSSDGVNAVRRMRDEVALLKPNLDGLSTALSGVISPTTLAAAAITGLAAAGLKAGLELFELTKQTAEYGSQIYDASQKTGLGAESLSALKYAAEQSGSSFEEITANVSKFNVLIGEANNKNEKAEATLKQYGITAKTTDGALVQAISTIAAMTSADQQAAAAKALFKDRTAAILPVIKSFDGDLPSLISKLREMGLIMSDQDAKAADEFGDQMDLLNRQLGEVGRTLGRELMPVFLEFSREVSSWLSSNKGEVKGWAEFVANTVRSMVIDVKQELVDLQGIAAFLDGFFGLASDAATQNKLANLRLQSDRLGKLKTGQQDVTAPAPIDYSRPGDFKKPGTTTLDPAAAKDAASEAEKRRKELEALAKRDADAVLRIGANVLDTLNDQFQKAYDKLLEGLTSNENIDAFKSQVNGLIDWYNSAWLDNALKLDKLEIAQAKKGGATKNELALLETKQQDRQIEMLDRITKLRKAAEVAEVKTVKDTAAEKDKTQKEEVRRTQESIAAELALYVARSNTQITILDRELAQKLLSETEYARKVGQIRLEILEKELTLTTDVNKRAILEEEIKQQKAQNAIDAIKALEKETDAQEKLNKEKEKALELETRKANKAARASIEQGTAGLDSIAGGLGLSLPEIFGPQDQIKSQAEFLKNVYADVADTAGQAIGSMVDGLAQMAAQWLITGDFSAKAALSMMASIALSIATQAGMTAIMEYAKGMAEAAAAAASYAVGDVPGGVLHTQAAGLHFAAATVFGTVAAIAGGAGVGLALGARAAGAGGGSGGGSKGPQQQATDDRDDFRDTSPISRSDGRTYDSGSRPFEHTLAEIARHLIDVRASHDRVANALSTIETANVGDVFTRGEAARPLVVPSRVVKHLDSNAGFGTAIQRKTGGR